jgi:hypothetical protein
MARRLNAGLDVHDCDERERCGTARIRCARHAAQLGAGADAPLCESAVRSLSNASRRQV